MQESNMEDCNHNIVMARNIFDKYGDFIFSVIRHNIRDDKRVDDLFQDFFLSLVASPIPNDVKNIKLYLYKVISNDLIRKYRNIKHYRPLDIKYTEHEKFMYEDRPETNLMATEEMESIFKIINNSLSHKESLAVTLKYKNNYDTEAIAKVMDLNKKSASRYISAGLRKIRRLIVMNEEEDKPITATIEKAERQKTRVAEILELNISVGEFSPEDEVAKGIVSLYRALNKYYIASGGNGLVIDDWQSFIRDNIYVEI